MGNFDESIMPEGGTFITKRYGCRILTLLRNSQTRNLQKLLLRPWSIGGAMMWRTDALSEGIKISHSESRGTWFTVGFWCFMISLRDSMILDGLYGVSYISCFSDLPELFTRNQVPDAS